MNNIEWSHPETCYISSLVLIFFLTSFSKFLIFFFQKYSFFKKDQGRTEKVFPQGISWTSLYAQGSLDEKTLRLWLKVMICLGDNLYSCFVPTSCSKSMPRACLSVISLSSLYRVNRGFFPYRSIESLRPLVHFPAVEFFLLHYTWNIKYSNMHFNRKMWWSG